MSTFSEYGYQTGEILSRALQASSADTSAKLDRVIDLLSGQAVAAGTSTAATSDYAVVAAGQTQSHIIVVGDPDRGTSADDGRVLAKSEHILQSLMHIFTTPVGTLVMRRDYGSLIPSLVDAPLNESTLLRIVHGAAESALKWEKRLRKLLLVVTDISEGTLSLGIVGEDEDGNTLRYDEVLL